MKGWVGLLNLTLGATLFVFDDLGQQILSVRRLNTTPEHGVSSIHRQERCQAVDGLEKLQWPYLYLWQPKLVIMTPSDARWSPALFDLALVSPTMNVMFALDAPPSIVTWPGIPNLPIPVLKKKSARFSCVLLFSPFFYGYSIKNTKEAFSSAVVLLQEHIVHT